MSKTETSPAKKERGIQVLACINNGELEQIDDLLKAGVDFAQTSKGDAAIHLAARKGLLPVIEKLLKHGDKRSRPNENRNTPLHYAAREGHMHIVIFLKGKGAEMNPQNENGDTPLHFCAVRQYMDYIEQLVKLGMNPNTKNKMGRTPLHVAVENSRVDAIEALLLCGGNPNIVDNVIILSMQLLSNFVTTVNPYQTENKKAVDLSKNAQISDVLSTYADLRNALHSGFITAQGVLLDPKKKKTLTLDRINVHIPNYTCNELLPFQLYSKREKTENSHIKFDTETAEEVISDIYIFRVTDSVDVITFDFLIPLYSAVGSKEEPILKFQNGRAQEAFSDAVIKGESYCPLTLDLRADEEQVFVIFTRPKAELRNVNTDASTVQSKVDESFTLDVPAGTFDDGTTLSMTVYEGKAHDLATKKINTSESRPVLLTDVYQVNVRGNQPAHEVTVQFPFKASGSKEQDDIIILAADETTMVDETSLEIIPSKPEVADKNVVFQASHFSIHVAVQREVFIQRPREVYDRILGARNRVQAAVFFVMTLEGKEESTVVVEVVERSRVQRRIKHWSSKGYKQTDDYDLEPFMTEPCHEFEVQFSGNVRTNSSSSVRRLAFMPRRASFQPYSISVQNFDKPPEGATHILKLDRGQNSDEESDAGEITPANGSDWSTRELTKLSFTLPPPLVITPGNFDPKDLEPIEPSVSEHVVCFALSDSFTANQCTCAYDVVTLESIPEYEVKSPQVSCTSIGVKRPLSRYLRRRFPVNPWIPDGNKSMEKKIDALFKEYGVTSPTNQMRRKTVQYAQQLFRTWRDQVFLALVTNHKAVDTAAMSLEDLCTHVLSDFLSETEADPSCMTFIILLRCCAHQTDAFAKSSQGTKPASSEREYPVSNVTFWKEFEAMLDQYNLQDKQTLKRLRDVEQRRITNYKEKFMKKR